MWDGSGRWPRKGDMFAASSPWGILAVYPNSQFIGSSSKIILVNIWQSYNPSCYVLINK